MRHALNERFLSLPSSGNDETGKYLEFQNEVRQFAQRNCPDDIREKVRNGEKVTRPVYSRWQQILCKQGWAAPSWPKEHGGTGWDLRQRMIFEEAIADFDCPPLYHHGLGHIGPVIMHFGTPEQKAKYLPRIIDTSDWWCQGYSEPNSGSDLASLQTRAERHGDHYVVNGQKIWTSHGHEANIIYLLVRTSREAKKQDGISLLLVDMDTPGITVRPIETIDGWHHVNEVFFENVRVPADRLVGEEGKGWNCAKYLLERERLPPASVAQLVRQWRRVAHLLWDSRRENARDRDYAALDQRMLMLAAQIKGAREMLASAIDDMMQKRPLGAKPSALKLMCSLVAQALTEVALRVTGPAATQRFLTEQGGQTDAGLWLQNYLFTRSKTIAGGTTEVQRNVVARELLGA
ncbi:acyl-CoA dehydrogenase family protein [Parapusillimonas granuli]|uniref:Acyl-CoA dehydrogenase family protein n=1 Tax=Parapusillimonas granuli TaxID=380911 RepID=A0A853FUA0_9BURK|nr:acyl-CoA dehydrogenase family protein [Parapusillimonas granuli]MBB5216531.1 alkylation response protein AidB-like acyl-CoA dehydrogenase [Parapusillimonas granuli]MEB2399726.1 acyl-CoA dehydrogenase family protein [Alcaligenaceae bacterium]NYT48163.1 acyl-CoA dehydrogenase family protein [Parapusillimonas granuli]